MRFGEKVLNDQNIFGVVEPNKTPLLFSQKNYKPGDFVDVKIKSCTSATLIGKQLKSQIEFNMDSLQLVKQRFGIIGNNLGLNRALEKSLGVSNTDISVLVMNCVGKKTFQNYINILASIIST